MWSTSSPNGTPHPGTVCVPQRPVGGVMKLRLRQAAFAADHGGGRPKARRLCCGAGAGRGAGAGSCFFRSSGVNVRLAEAHMSLDGSDAAGAAPASWRQGARQAAPPRAIGAFVVCWTRLELTGFSPCTSGCVMHFSASDCIQHRAPSAEVGGPRVGSSRKCRSRGRDPLVPRTLGPSPPHSGKSTGLRL